MKRIIFGESLTLSEKRKYSKQLRSILDLEEFTHCIVEIDKSVEDVFVRLTFDGGWYTVFDVYSWIQDSQKEEFEYFVDEESHEDETVFAEILLEYLDTDYSDKYDRNL